MKRVNQPAALHWAAGAIKDNDVAVGTHDLSRVRIVITCPDGAAVHRGPGSEGDGYEATAPTDKISIEAALLFIERAGLVGPTTFGLWKSCLREAMETKVKAKDHIPTEAAEALKALQSEMQDECKGKKATPATRTGIAGVQICVERLTKTRLAFEEAVAVPRRQKPKISKSNGEP